MTSSPPVAFDTLSPTIPVFPLLGTLLLPRGELPLHVFEERYRDMVRDSASAHGLIGIIQPTEPQEHADRPKLFGIGCVGRMDGLQQLDDGRYYLTLVGLCRFKILEELPMANSYREVVADYQSYLTDLNPAPPAGTNREELFSVLKSYLDARELETDWSQISDVQEEDLINALAMTCPFDPREKQALLEAPGIFERSEILITLLKMSGMMTGGEIPVLMQ